MNKVDFEFMKKLENEKIVENIVKDLMEQIEDCKEKGLAISEINKLIIQWNELFGGKKVDRSYYSPLNPYLELLEEK